MKALFPILCIVLGIDIDSKFVHSLNASFPIDFTLAPIETEPVKLVQFSNTESAIVSTLSPIVSEALFIPVSWIPLVEKRSVGMFFILISIFFQPLTTPVEPFIASAVVETLLPIYKFPLKLIHP